MWRPRSGGALLVGLLVGGGAGVLVGPAAGRLSSTAQDVPRIVQTETLSPRRADAGYPADVLRVIDGDTFHARVHVWPGIDITTRVRLRTIDAPELRARCPRELALAEQARSYMGRLLAAGDVRIAGVTNDKYGGRVVADVSTREEADVGAAMLKAKLARPYRGGRRLTWCDGPDRPR